MPMPTFLLFGAKVLVECATRHRNEKEERNKDYYLSERRYGSFQRSFSVPDTPFGDRLVTL